jgi:hypothetical protein
MRVSMRDAQRMRFERRFSSAAAGRFGHLPIDDRHKGQKGE